MKHEAGRTPRLDWATQAALGTIAWLVWAAAARPEWTAVLLLLSPFVIVPLGLRVAGDQTAGPTAPLFHRLAELAPFLALTAAASFIPEPGTVAALLSVPWLVFTLAIALLGAARLLSRRSLVEPGIAVDAGLLFVLVGGAWLTLSRAGLQPLGFNDAIVQLTAVHFHYAGYALPIVAGFIGGRLGRSMIVPIAVIVGVPLTAIGIIAGGWLEWVAATAMALAGIATAVQLLRFATRQNRNARSLLTLAGLSLLAGMTLAIGWAWAVWFGVNYLGLASMAATHGSLNALGFGLLGLAGLNLVLTEPEATPSHAVNMHLGRPSTEALTALASRATGHATTNEIGLLNRSTPEGFSRKVWTRDIAHRDFDAAAEAIRRWRGHQAAGISRSVPEPEIVPGTTLAMAIPVGPLAVTASCRIVDVVDQPDRFGFTYSTLPHHVVDGEESFIVTRHDDGQLDITVTAVWRGATVANAVLPPLTRFLQNRAINKYLDGIASWQPENLPHTAKS